MHSLVKPDGARGISERIDVRGIVGFSTDKEEEELDGNDRDGRRSQPLIAPEPPHARDHDGKELRTGEQQLLQHVGDRAVGRASVLDRVGDAVPVVPGLPCEVRHQEKDGDAETEPRPWAGQVQAGPGAEQSDQHRDAEPDHRVLGLQADAE